jgi:adenine-specific DNA-methyltransferase
MRKVRAEFPLALLANEQPQAPLGIGISAHPPASYVGCSNWRKFPSTRYQGSKRKILPWIWRHLSKLDFSSALDVFGGAGSVSYLLKAMGKQVTYNDNLRFNYLVGLALIENDDVILDYEDTAFALGTPDPAAARYFVQDTFHGVYFTDDENKWIDRIVSRIANLGGDPAKAFYKKALLNYALFQTCLIKRPYNLFHRRNLYFRFADVERSFYNKGTWDKPFADHFLAFCAIANKAVFRGIKQCRAICFDAAEIPGNSYDLVYVDPPYLRKTCNESCNYLRCYHFLEGLARYDEWGDLVDYETVNLRFKDANRNSWIDRDAQLKAFDALLEKFPKSILVASYKKFGFPSIDTLIRMFKRHGRKVRSRSQHYIYALNHQNGQAKLNREVLFISEP